MNSKVYKWCMVPQCANTSKRTPNKLFVHVPNKKSIRHKWLNLGGRDPTSIRLNSPIYFCEDHFDLPNDMVNYMEYHVMGSVSQVRMKPGCIPTKFVCQSDSKKRSSDTAERPYYYMLKKQRQILIEASKHDLEDKQCIKKHLELGETSSGNSEMTEKSIMIEDLESALEFLEDENIDNPRLRSQNYQVIKGALDSGAPITVNRIDRILAICVQSMKEDLKYAAVLVDIISVVLKKIKAGEYSMVPNLVPSALAVITIINTTGVLPKVDSLKLLCMETLLSYPDETHITIATLHYEELMELIKLQGYVWTSNEVTFLINDLLFKLLNILPPEKKADFVKSGVSIWFSKTVPAIVNLLITSCASNLYMENYDTTPLEVLEILTNELVKFDYTENTQWKNFFEGSICDAKRYPESMKTLLVKGSPIWHRMWIVFIRLLNNQITRNTSSVGTPINSMLPVVETAFKLDPINRCRAFQCWSVLIDIFCNETNENCVNKRLKLLIIPLKLNNAKVEETALAKFDSWWHLITKFQNRLDKFVDTVFISFLHFCFGKHNASGKSTFIPGQLSDRTKRLCVQAFVEIVGHVNCNGCTHIPSLKRKLLTTKYLVDHWNDWMHSLKTVIKLSAKNISTPQQVKCLWMSFLLTIGELPDNNIRKDLYYELLEALSLLTQDCKIGDMFADIVLNVLILSLFDEETKVKQLLKTKCMENCAVLKIITIITDPAIKHFYQSFSSKELVTKFKPISNFIVEESSNTAKNVLKWILEVLPSNDVTLKLWTALTESVCESENVISKSSLCDMLLWPLHSMNLFTDVNLPARAWYTMYTLMYTNLNATEVENTISCMLMSSNVVTNSSTYFTLCVTLAILKNGLVNGNSNRGYENEARLFHTLIDRIDCYDNIKEVFPMIVDTLVVMLNKATDVKYDTLAQHTITTVKNVLKLMTPEIKQKSDIDNNILIVLETLFKSLSAFLKIESYSKLLSVITDDLVHYSTLFGESLRNFDLQLPAAETNDKSAKNKIESVTRDVISDASDRNMDKSNFSTPNTKVSKKVRKKGTNIVNTVVENGEEFVVVKSNWKFNPRNLTENQKEKLQRKREDIPALYQDLSQSQDEYKLTVWKTDSQDTTTTSKSSSKSTNEGSDAALILRNLPSTDVLPKIMENFLTDRDNKESDKTIKSSQDIMNKPKPLTPKTPKTPRMALKDRVFRNMRNLIEKSNPKVGEDVAEEQNQIENIPKTPQATKPKTDTANIINSAPSLLLSERPSRVKRKPKKFDDLEIFELKKRRHSQNDSQPDIEIAASSTANPIDKDENLVDIAQLPLNDIPNTHEKSDDFQRTENITLNGQTGPESNIEDTRKPEVDVTKGEINQTNIADRCDPTDEVMGSKVIEHTCSVEQKPNEDDGCGLGINIMNNSEVTAPKQTTNAQEVLDRDSSLKKNKVKKSRIEKELAIDMVEGHPFLNTPSSSDKRSTRKNIASPITSIRRKKLIDKLNKSKFFTETTDKTEIKEIDKFVNKEAMSFTVNETEDRLCNLSQNIPCSEDPCSEDIIESSQDSTLTTITVIKKTPKKIPIVSIQRIEINLNSDENISETQNLLQDQAYEIVDLPDSLPAETQIVSKNEQNIFEGNALKEEPREIDADVETTEQDTNCEIVTLPDSSLNNQESKDDIELPRNETVVEDKNESVLTADMDTQPIRDKDITNDVIMIHDEEELPITISSEEPGLETQELANADTQPVDTSDFLETKTDVVAIIHDEPKKFESVTVVKKDKDINISSAHCTATQDDITKTISESKNISVIDIDNTGDVSSPFKDDDQRKQDFLNNTVEISPIKTLSPDRDKKSPSPETSGDYVVITLSSPVHSNGEPFEKGSPEFFTDDKISPDKRDQSPPRVELSVTNTSPSSSLSLKKNRPQVRAGGRAAQMLGLCVPEKLHTMLNTDRSETEEGKKSSPSNTLARRNLRILYNSVGDVSDNHSESEDNEHFLKLRRSLPAVDLSPAGPILKRKLVEITDDATVSPANKRKRVSFHDPPVSTTVSVQKYIEPYGVRSPQSSAQKRLERQMRPQTNMKSPKRLDAVFKLDSALTKAVESFTEIDIIVSNDDDTQITSLDQTPAVEIVKTSELNDTDPICPDLLDCKDPIDNIAAELSSPAMKSLFVKVFADKVETVGDLAKMTELEVNRLCIKAPKVEVAKRVLTDYASKMVGDNIANNNEVASDADVNLPGTVVTSANIHVQTDDVLSNDVEIQTVPVPLMLASTQTETESVLHTSVQTEESGSNSTAHVIASCLTERPDFVDQLSEQLDESSMRQLTEKLSFNTINDMLMKKTTSASSNIVLNRLLEHPSIQESSEQNKELSFLRDYLCNKFDSKDLILFCSQLLQKVYDKPA